MFRGFGLTWVRVLGFRAQGYYTQNPGAWPERPRFPIFRVQGVRG